MKVTVREIASSVIRFNTGMKNNDPEALRQFIPGFVDLLKRFNDLMLLPQNRTDEYCLKFKDDITAVFDDLFIHGTVYQKAEKAIQHDPDILGQLIAIKRNGNPLTANRIGLKRQSEVRAFDEFVAVNESLYSQNEVSSQTIIPNFYIAWIHTKFRESINEPLETWTERFVYPYDNPVKPMELDSKAVEGSDRLVVLAILSEIYKHPHSDFVYEKFVSDRFGIKNFHKAISIHKSKKGFTDTAKICAATLKK